MNGSAELATLVPRTVIEDGRTLLLYDGVCGLCNHLVQFLIRRDRRDRLRFAALQSPLGRSLVRAAGGDPDELDTLYVICAGRRGPEARVRSRAVLTAVGALGGIYRPVGWLRIVPAFILDPAYRVVARVRYRVFRHDTCVLPAPDTRARFLDVPDDRDPAH